MLIGCARNPLADKHLCRPPTLAPIQPARRSFLPRNTKVIGYARSPLTDEQLHAKLRPRLEGGAAEADAFLKRCTYVAGATHLWLRSRAAASVHPSPVCLPNPRTQLHPCCAPSPPSAQRAVGLLWHQQAPPPPPPHPHPPTPTPPTPPPKGAYDGPEGWKALAAALAAREARHPACPCGRLYYLALPPSVYPQVCSGLKVHLQWEVIGGGGRAGRCSLHLLPRAATLCSTPSVKQDERAVEVEWDGGLASGGREDPKLAAHCAKQPTPSPLPRPK